MRLVFHSQTTVCRLNLVVLYSCARMNTLVDTLKPQSDVLLYRSTVTGALAVDGWAVTFGTARRGLGGLWPSRCIRCNSPPINGQCTKFTLFDVALYFTSRSRRLRGRRIREAELKIWTFFIACLVETS